MHNMPTVFGIVTRTNGKRRTPIEALHRMIERVGTPRPLLEIDKQRPILSDGWFSRMFEAADGHFAVQYGISEEKDVAFTCIYGFVPRKVRKAYQISLCCNML